jgi:hypothetical protein
MEGFGVIDFEGIYYLRSYLLGHKPFDISNIDPEIVRAEVENKDTLSSLRNDYRIAQMNPANCNMDLAKPLSPELFNQMVRILNYMPVKFRKHILRSYYGWLEEEPPTVAGSSPPRPTAGAGSSLASPTVGAGSYLASPTACAGSSLASPTACAGSSLASPTACAGSYLASTTASAEQDSSLARPPAGAEQDSNLASRTTSPGSWSPAGAGSSPSRPTAAPAVSCPFLASPSAKINWYIMKAQAQRALWRSELDKLKNLKNSH